MAIKDVLDNIKNGAVDAAGKGQDWLKNEFSQLESWSRENTQQAKEKLLAKAQEYGIAANSNMDVGEIKNKIKAKLRAKFPGNN